MKSLAHPGWPYAGTPNEWRGFGGDKRHLVPGESMMTLEELEKARETFRHLTGAIYQKQNLGPDLD